LAADALSALVTLIIAGVAAAAAVHSVGFLREDLRGRDLDRGQGLRDLQRYFVLYHLFVFAMLLIPLSNSLGVVWIAIEGTTLASLFLVSYYGTREALEAAWKYVIIGSVGIALALFGTILAYYAAVPVLGLTFDLNWSSLTAAAGRLDPAVMRLAFLFIVVGYGTKAGLAPMHTWLPDAYSEAPSPVSALLAAGLESAAIYAILRFYTLAAPSVGVTEVALLLLGFGLLSLVVSALFMLRQADYKRLLAYSSIEHMGLVVVAVAFGGPLGMTAALLQLVSHALAKSLTFFAAGHVLLRYETKDIDHVSGVLRALPTSGTFLLLGGLALTGAPPFGLFVSEVAVLAAGFHAGFGIAAVVCLGCLVVIFVAFMGHLNRMAFGRVPADVLRGERARIGWIPLWVEGALLVILGLSLPGQFGALIHAATLALGVS
ncbi:MAG TPA: proton-conducting transporter membrane subunit, partial [Candidatus Saccharimonadales bacterium]|nr:proton-conducting transporter membrane subunit [Candidatus Saccharimonadales bacterium]